MIKIQREAKSRLSVDVVTADDSAAATVAFCFVLRGERPVTFSAGSWAGAAVQQRDGSWLREAITPRVGDVSLDLAQGHYRLYGKLVNGADEDIWLVDEEGLEVQ